MSIENSNLQSGSPSKFEWIIVGDGACQGNPGPGGFGGFVIQQENLVYEFGGNAPHSTNNRMELMALLTGLQHVAQSSSAGDHQRVQLILDSSYVLNGFCLYLQGWDRRGYTTASGDPLKNDDLWRELHLLKSQLVGTTFVPTLVKGHSGILWNERADQLAVGFCQGQPPELYRGLLASYPYGQTLGNEAEKALGSSVYVVAWQGRRYDFKAWPECEAFVRGKPGVKYKKVKTSQELESFLRSNQIDSFKF